MATKTKVNFNEFMQLAAEKPVGKREKEFKGCRALEITEKQKAALHKFGIGYSSMNWRGQASDVLEVAFRRAKNNLATAAQMRVLSKMGVSCVHKRTFKEAAFILNGNDPDNYNGFTYIFRCGDEEREAHSRKQADSVFQELRASGKPVQVKRVEA